MLRSATSRALALGRTLKPMIGAPLALARVTSLSVIAPTPECSTRTLISSVDRRLSAWTIASTEPWTSALTTSGNSLVVDACDGEHVLEADRRRGGALPVEHALAVGRDFARARLVLDHRERIAGRRHRRQAEHFDRDRRAGFLHLAAVVVDQRADLARARCARDEHVADAQRAALDEHGRERAAALVELGLDHRAFGGAVGVGLQFEDFGLELDRLEQLVEVGLLGRRDFDVLDLAAHLLDDDLVLEQLLADLLRLGVGLVDLVDRDDHRHAGRLGVVDRLDRLRLQAVVGRDHQDDDVGDVGAARAHLGEGLVARACRGR